MIVKMTETQRRNTQQARKTNNDTRKNFKTQFTNTSGTKTINGLTVEQRQSLSDALKPKADN